MREVRVGRDSMILSLLGVNSQREMFSFVSSTLVRVRSSLSFSRFSRRRMSENSVFFSFSPFLRRKTNEPVCSLPPSRLSPALASAAMADSALPAAPAAAGEQGIGGGASSGRGERSNANPSTPRLHLDPRSTRTRRSFHARVRADALARQRAARGEGIEAARAAARSAAAAAAREQQGTEGGATDVDAPETAPTATPPPTATDVANQDRRTSVPSPRPFWASQLMRHEWMVDAPDDLSRNW